MPEPPGRELIEQNVAQLLNKLQKVSKPIPIESPREEQIVELYLKDPLPSRPRSAKSPRKLNPNSRKRANSEGTTPRDISSNNNNCNNSTNNNTSSTEEEEGEEEVPLDNRCTPRTVVSLTDLEEIKPHLNAFDIDKGK